MNFLVLRLGPESEERLKRPEFSEAQAAVSLRQAEEGATVGEVCRKKPQTDKKKGRLAAASPFSSGVGD